MEEVFRLLHENRSLVKQGLDRRNTKIHMRRSTRWTQITTVSWWEKVENRLFRCQIRVVILLNRDLMEKCEEKRKKSV